MFPVYREKEAAGNRSHPRLHRRGVPAKIKKELPPINLLLYKSLNLTS